MLCIVQLFKNADVGGLLLCGNGVTEENPVASNSQNCHSSIADIVFHMSPAQLSSLHDMATLATCSFSCKSSSLFWTT